MGNGLKTIIGILLVIAIAWFGYSSMNTVGNDGPIKIGFIGPLTGDAVSYGEPISNAVRLAADEINASGGVNGRMIEVIYTDGKCTSRDAVNSVQKLVNIDKVQFIIGGVCSGETLPILPITEPAGVLVLSPSASSPDLTGAGEMFFRNNPSDESGGTFMADLLFNEYGVKKVAVISEETDYAQALGRVFMRRFKELGGEVSVEENFVPETNDFRSILTKVKASDAEALFINPQTEIAGGTIGRQANELGIEIQLFGSNILGGSKAIEIAGETIEGLVLFDSPGLNRGNAKASHFITEYERRYGDLSIEFYIGAGYDTMYILAQAIAETGEDSRMVREYLHAMPNYSGVIGTYGFDGNGDLTGINHVVKKVESGEVVTVE